MEIKVLSKDELEVLLDAWKISRPGEHLEDISRILAIDAPINDIPCAVLHITSSIAVREVFASARDHVMWAKTSRVSDPTEWGIQLDTEKLVALHHEQLSARDAGISQDIYRMLMPLGAITEYTVRISIRSIVKLSDYFKYLGIDNSALEEVISDWLGRHERPRYKLTKYLSRLGGGGDGIVGGFLVLTVTGSLALRAQAVRHRQFIIKDTFEELLMGGEYREVPINSEITMQLCASIDFWRSILEKRSCWLAQYGIWSDVIRSAQRHIKVEENLLPCKEYCVYSKDAELRYTDSDPGSPCPKHAVITKHAVTQKQLEDIEKQFKLEERPHFWRNIINAIR